MKILFLHGFYASGQCVPAVALKEAFGDKAAIKREESELASIPECEQARPKVKAEVLTPDLPMHPKEAINFIRNLIVQSWKNISLTTTIQSIRNEFGESLVSRIRWHTSNRCSWSITATRITSLVAIRPQQKKCIRTMCH